MCIHDLRTDATDTYTNMTLTCDRCDDGKTYDDYRGARGHVKFTSGGGHGDSQEVPDGYKSMFTEIDDDDGDVEEPDADETPESDDTETGGDGSSTRDSGGSDDESGRLRRLVDTDVRELFGGS